MPACREEFISLGRINLPLQMLNLFHAHSLVAVLFEYTTISTALADICSSVIAPFRVRSTAISPRQQGSATDTQQPLLGNGATSRIMHPCSRALPYLQTSSIACSQRDSTSCIHAVVPSCNICIHHIHLDYVEVL